ncbi:MAG TPA: AAA family ATPase [Burkholderiaceae bacterium]|nr:AAA family ATPase [Burkholderiaceae bacterium]
MPVTSRSSATDPRPGATPIAIAGFRQIYSTSRVEAALDELPAGASESLKGTYEKMLKAGGDRFSVKPAAMPDFDALVDELPNFGEVLEDLRRQLVLCLETADPVELTPLLLLGEPGIGKTRFARRLSQLLGTGYGFVSMGSLTAGWILSGASSQWRNARAGKVFDTLVHGDYANPVMVVDEIDKASADGQYDPLGALYALLEPDTAAEFVDEFAEVPVDCSDIVWVATANDIGRIPDPILNRMNVYEIPPPDRDGARRIAQGLYREIRDSHEWGAQFPEQLAEAVADRLARCAPREMRRQLVGAFGSAKLAGRSEIELHDLANERSARRVRIGF